MCYKESSVEWSGVLFYSTEGEFGKEGFKCTAEELILMDIGTGAYTEYDYDEKFVGIMMKNPHLMKLKRGHIHSHNNMAVFFSGTDTNEIVDNSEHYNYYLSLIVNNRNEMTAKIAFRANVINEGKKIFIYKGNEGKEESSEDSFKEEKTAVLIYDCEIAGAIPLVDEKFLSRYEEIKKAKVTTTYASSYSNARNYYNHSDYGSNNSSAYSPSRFSYSPGMKEKKTEEVVQTDMFGKGSHGYTHFQTDDDVQKEVKESEADEEIASYQEGIEDFIKEVCDPGNYHFNLEDLLDDLNKTKRERTHTAWKYAMEDMKNGINAAYNKTFTDPKYEYLKQTIEDAQTTLRGKYSSETEGVIDDIITNVLKY